MRISNIEGETANSQTASISPKVVQLIEKIASQPLLIQKILLDAKNFIQLETNSNQLKQLQLPLSQAELIAPYTKSPIQLSLSLVNRQLAIELAPLSKNPDALHSKNNSPIVQQPIQLIFKNAQLINERTLKLGQAINRQFPVIKPLNLNIPIDTSANTTTSNLDKNDTTLQQQAELKQAISHFLKSKPRDLPSLSKSINQLIKMEKSLIDSLITENASNLVKYKAKTQPPALHWDNSSIKELLTLLSKHTNGDNPHKLLQQLNEKISQLTDQLAFSASNKSLKLDKRIEQSGLFLESNWRKTSTKPDTTGVNIDGNTTADKKGVDQLGIRSQLVKLKHQLTRHLKSEAKPLKNNLLSDQSKPIKNDTITESTSLTNKSSSSNKSIEQATQMTHGKPQPSNNLQDLKLQFHSIGQILKSLNKLNQSAVTLDGLVKQLTKLPEVNRMLQEESETIIQQSSKPSPQKLSTNSQNATSVEISTFDKLALSISPKLKQLLVLAHQQLQGGVKLINEKQLESLAAAQTNILKEMLIESNALINKIENNQLLTLKNDLPFQQQFLLDLPIYRAGQVDSFEILFKSKNAQTNGDSKIWSVVIRFDLAPLGAMFAKVSLKNKRISTHFFAKDETTANLLSEHIDQLKNSLFVAGLDIEEIVGQQGLVPEQLLQNDEYNVDIHV